MLQSFQRGFSRGSDETQAYGSNAVPSTWIFGVGPLLSIKADLERLALLDHLRIFLTSEHTEDDLLHIR